MLERRVLNQRSEDYVNYLPVDNVTIPQRRTSDHVQSNCSESFSAKKRRVENVRTAIPTMMRTIRNSSKAFKKILFRDEFCPMLEIAAISKY